MRTTFPFSSAEVWAGLKRKQLKEGFLAVQPLRMCKDHVTQRQAWGPHENVERRNGGRLGEAGMSSGVRVKVPVGVTWQSFSAFKLILRKFLLLSCLKAEKMEVLYIFFILLHGCETGGKYVWFCMISDKN